MSFTTYLKSKAKQILGFSVLAALVTSLVMPTGATRAAEPRFNIHGEDGVNGDYELFRGANLTNNETVWKDPISGGPNDTFKAVVYYHNGEQDTVAQNTHVKVTIPTSTVSKTANLTATISADNAPTTTDTHVEGSDTQIVGLSGLTVNLASDANLSLVPGTVKWFPDAKTKGIQTPTPLPNGQTGDEIISTNGINLGDIQGCWQFAGYVTFEFKATAKPFPINITKQVKNLSRVEANYAKTTNASAGEQVQYQVSLLNTAATAVVNPRLKDVMPAELTYAPGSFESFVGNAAGTSQTDTIAAIFFDGGWDTGVTINSGETFGVRFKATVNAGVPFGKAADNTATVIVNNESASDNATVNIIAGAINVAKSKSVINNTSGKAPETKVVGGKTVISTTARAGDQLTYTLTTKNNGAASINYVVEDGIADILEYADVIQVSDGGSVVPGTTGFDAQIVRYPSVSLAPGQSIDRTFTIKIKTNLPGNPPKGTSFDDVLYNLYGNEVVVCIERPTVVKKVELSIRKDVRDFTSNEANFVDANEAFAGDILEYKVSFTNSGNMPADLVKFSDAIPANTEYIKGTTVLSKNNGPEHTLIDGITTGGITIDSIGSGESGYLKFRVLTSSKLAANEILKNIATLDYKDIKLSDEATTKIKAPVVAAPVKPHLPVTGAASATSFFLTMTLGVVSALFRYRKMLGDNLEVIRVASDIINL